jgi:hypothetical protein
MTKLFKPRDLGQFLIGVVLGLAVLFVAVRFPGLFLNNEISRYMRGVMRMYSWLDTIYMLIYIAVYLLIARYLYYKRSPFMGYGFLISLLVPVLFFFMLIIEIIIHPPSEE